jgi:signal transduction histidine kinase
MNANAAVSLVVASLSAGLLLGWFLARARSRGASTANLEHQTLEQGPVSFALIGRDGHSTWVGRNLERLLGYGRGALPPLERLWLLREGGPSLEALLTSLQPGSRPASYEVDLPTRDGGRFATVVTAIRASGGTLLSFQDASAFALLGGRDDVLAGVAHGLNNPLAGIRLHAELLEAELGEVPESSRERMESSLKNVDDCVERMERILKENTAWT